MKAKRYSNVFENGRDFSIYRKYNKKSREQSLLF